MKNLLSRKTLTTLGAASLLIGVLACGPAAPTATAPDADPTASPTGTADAKVTDTSDPFVVTDLLREEPLPLLKGPAPTFDEATLAAPLKGVPAAPASCDAYVKRSPKKKPTCADKASGLAALDAAVQGADDAQVDELLAGAEACTGLEPGIVRAIRIELAPAECGDVLAEPFLKTKPAGLSGAVQHTLVGQAIAARLSRTVGTPPKLTAPFDKKRVLDFTKNTLFPWFDQQRAAVAALSGQGRNLASYGKGLVALSSGWAYLRLVEVVREAPIPDEFRRDPEIANAYFAAVDEKLEPTKANGRDGALVGLGMMAQGGVLHDGRMQVTRALLAKMYGGRRIDALDVLELPRIGEPSTATTDQRLAAKLPTFLAGLLLDPGVAKDPKVLASLLHRGIPMPMRAALKEGEATLSKEAKALYARGRFELGIRYWRTVDFDTTVALLSKIPRAELAEADRLLLASAIALRNGPEDIAVLMLKNDAFHPRFADVRALDAFVKSSSDKALVGVAAFDAAVLRQIATPRDADGAYWEGLAERYRQASGLLVDESVRHESDERAKAAVQTAKVLKTTSP